MSSLPTTHETVENPLFADLRFHRLAGVASEAPEWQRREVANQVLNFFRGSEGYPAGNFTQMLLSLMGSADPNNQSILFNAYPIYGEAFVLGQQFAGGLEILRGRAAK